jgi:hypothetical protein
MPAGFAAGEIRQEFRLDDLVDASITDDALVSTDPYTQYSFAMAIRRGRFGPSADLLSDPPTAPFSNDLLELRIMVFRNFDQAAADDLKPLPAGGVPSGGAGVSLPAGNVPVATFITKVATN